MVCKDDDDEGILQSNVIKGFTRLREQLEALQTVRSARLAQPWAFAFFCGVANIL